MQQKGSLEIVKLPNRPQRNVQSLSQFKKVNVLSNHFPFEFKDAQNTRHIYSIAFSEDVPQDAREMRYAILQLGKTELKDQLKDYIVRGLNIWSPTYVKNRIIVKVSYNKKDISIYVDHTKQVSFQYLEGNNEDPQLMQPLQQAVNVQVKRALKDLGLTELNRLAQFFDKRTIDSQRLEDFNLRVWIGYKTSLKLTGGKPQLLIDYASRVISSQNALSYINSIRGNNQAILDEMIGKSVLATYGNYRLYKISDVRFEKKPSDKFKTEDQKEISFVQYYKEKYGIQIKDLKQPLFESIDKRNPDKKFYLIPELMFMTGLTDAQRADFGLMKDLAQYTKKEPQDRYEKILVLLNQLKTQLGKNNMILNKDSATQAFICPQPELLFFNGRKLDPDSTGFFILKDPVYQAAQVKDWILIYQAREKKDDDLADELVNHLQSQGTRLGIKFADPYFVNMKGNKPQDWIKELDKEFKKSKPPQLVVSLIDKNRDKSLYISLKEFLLGQAGVPHQNVTTKLLKGKAPNSSVNKVAQQINVKLGFPLWVIPKIKGVSEKILIVGIDIFHKLIDKKNSCMGFVAHFDLECKSNFSKVIIMRQGQELNQEIGRTFVEALKEYFISNGKKYMPDTILVYRDGVGDSQINALIETELKQIKNSFSTIQPGYNPAFAYISVNKKISDRFFLNINDAPQQLRQRTKDKQYINPCSGLVVADRITSRYFDFFLAAQYVTQGTCTPTHYTVLENTTNWTEETFWQLTYFQCFNYQNWTGAVKVPACVQYAHKLAFLIGDTYRGQINKCLQRQLVFL